VVKALLKTFNVEESAHSNDTRVTSHVTIVRSGALARCVIAPLTAGFGIVLLASAFMEMAGVQQGMKFLISSEALWLLFGVWVFLAILLAIHNISLARSFPRTIELFPDHIRVRTPLDDAVYETNACRWWIGSFFDDSFIGYDDTDMTSVVIQVRPKLGGCVRFACGRGVDVMPIWITSLKMSGMRQWDPPSKIACFKKWLIGVSFATVASVVLAAFAECVGMQWTHSAFGLCWHFGLWIVVFGMFGVGGVYSGLDGFSIASERFGAITFVAWIVMVSVLGGTFVGLVGGAVWMAVSTVVLGTLMAWAATPAILDRRNWFLQHERYSVGERMDT